MKLSDPEVNAELEGQARTITLGGICIVILGTYDALDRYERVAYPGVAIIPMGDKLPTPVNVNRSLLERFQDDELQKLAGSESRQDQSHQGSAIQRI